MTFTNTPTSLAGTPGEHPEKPHALGGATHTQGWNGPYLENGVPVAGWEVELPSKKLGMLLTSRYITRLTKLPAALSHVMGEAEYLEQVAQLNTLKDDYLQRNLMVVGPLIVTAFVTLAAASSAVAGTLAAFAGLEDLMLGFLVTAIFIMGLGVSPSVAVSYVYCKHWLAKKRMEDEQKVASATARWANRGIAWRLKVSEPVATENEDRVYATYERRLVIEMAPNAMELFQTHGPFPSSHSVSGDMIESEDADSEEDLVLDNRATSIRLSEIETEERIGIPFSLPYVDLSYNQRIRFSQKMPLMLSSVMTADEYEEQVGVFNREVERADKRWRMSWKLLMVYVALLGPSLCLSPVPMWACSATGCTNVWLAPTVTLVLLGSYYLSFLVLLLLSVIYRRVAIAARAEIVKLSSDKWAARAIEWYYSDDRYELTYGKMQEIHHDRRACIRILPGARERFLAMGPFVTGAIDGAVSSQYDLTPMAPGSASV